MGSSQSSPSASASAPPPREGTFGVRFSPDLLDGAAGQLPAGAASAPSGSEAQDQLPVGKGRFSPLNMGVNFDLYRALYDAFFQPGTQVVQASG